MSDELKDREPKWSEVASDEFCKTEGDTTILLIPPEMLWAMHTLCTPYNRDQRIRENSCMGKARFIGDRVDPSLKMTSACLVKCEVPGK